MATKKTAANLRLEPQPLMIPDGLYVLPTPILLFQKTSGLLWANPSFEKEFGVALATRFNHPQALHLLRERPVTLEIFSMVGRHEGFVLENLKAEKTPVELRIAHYGDASQECYLVMVEDVTTKLTLEKKLIDNHLELQNAFEQLRVTQAALIQTAKLASLGELSSGIAHELNQPLQAIMGFSQELEHMEKLSDTGKEFLGDIINASQKMAEIIKSLRSFAREAGEELSQTSVDHALKEAARLMKHQLMQQGIDLEIKTTESKSLITANPIQLEQVFINILGNARDAIETEVAARGKKQGKIQVELREKAGEIEVRIRDNGCGMTEETREKIFDPFFTTKEVGKGTGLGMSISYGILQKIHAKIEVESEPGKGSEFTLSFPIEQFKKGA